MIKNGKINEVILYTSTLIEMLLIKKINKSVIDEYIINKYPNSIIGSAIKGSGIEELKNWMNEIYDFFKKRDEVIYINSGFL